jgi:hypothetical protein
MMYVISDSPNPIGPGVKWYSDDAGGCLFKTAEAAQRVMDFEGLKGCHVVESGLDPDLEAMTKPYCFMNNL